MTIKIGFVQFAPVLGDVVATMSKLDQLTAQAEPADLLVLPELCNSGYNFTSSEQAWQTAEEFPGGVFVEYLHSLCAKHGYHIVSGLNEREGDHLYNSAVLIGPHGYLGRYRKLHLFMNEKDYFQPGDADLPVFDLGFCKVGMLVCFDWQFPEAWRILALKGADIICHPANLVLPGLAQSAVPIHALINRLYTVTANRIGSEGSLTFTGLSTIADPRGRVLHQASPEEEGVVVIEVDITLARDKNVTSRNHVLDDRRTDAYSGLLSDAG